jgi:hypothetical protein
LRAAPDEFERAHDQHCRYYADLLTAYQPQLQASGPALQEAMGALSAERENVRAAWNWAVEHRKVVEINQFMDCL